MIVCICNNVSDKAIRRAVHAGITSLSGLRVHLEVGTCCGKCKSCAKTVLRACMEDQATKIKLQQEVYVTA